MRLELEEGNTEALPELLKIREFFTESLRPKNFNPFDSNNDLLLHEKEFEAICSGMEEAGIQNAKNMTVFEFYSRVEHFEKRNKQSKN